MSLIKYHRPTGLSRFFDDPFVKGFFQDSVAHRPAVNVRETDDDFQLELAAPGRKKEDFKLEVKDQILTISYEVAAEQKAEKSGYLRREYRLETFKRSFHLDDKVIDDEAIVANYEDGILRLTLPKRAEAQAKGPKVITIA